MTSALKHALICGLAAIALSGCDAGGVGEPCVPIDEYRSDFPGYALGEASVESRSFECATRVCLVNHFQGRVSCPYGQRSDDLGRPGTDPRRCRVPGTTGDAPGEAVSVAVGAWDLDRPAQSAVYCSCRCDGPDRNAHYCECPKGYTCTEILPNLKLGIEQTVGSYCVREGSEFRPEQSGGPTCADTPDPEVCQAPPFVNP